jgi:hydrogenase maturation protease
MGAIVGVGNVLQSDDGIGVTILKYLEAAFRFPPHVSLIDGGTAGAGLQSAILGKQWLLIVDALAVPGDPGEIRLIAGRDIMARPADLKLSPHQVSFFDLLQLMELRGLDAPEFSILGVIPHHTGVGTELSPPVAAAVEKAVAAILKWLNAEGIAPEPVQGAITPDYWWRRQSSA